MADILFKIPKWPGSNPRLIRWTDVVENNRGECFVVDTCNLIANPKDDGYFETTVTPYDIDTAYDVIFSESTGKKLYAEMWKGSEGKRTWEDLRCKQRYACMEDALDSHMSMIEAL